MIVPKAEIFSKVPQIRIFLAVMTVVVITMVTIIPAHYSAAQLISEPYGPPYGMEPPPEAMQAPNSYVVELNEIDFDQAVAGSGMPVFVTFWAPSCGPCQSMVPIVEHVAQFYGDKLLFGRVNVDDNPGIAMRYQVNALPTFIVFENGMPIDGLVGAYDGYALENLAWRNTLDLDSSYGPSNPADSTDFEGGSPSEGQGNAAPTTSLGGSSPFNYASPPYTGPP